MVKKVEALAAPLCESEGLELVYVEFQRESAGWVLRVYVDKPTGVSLDDCARVSRQLGDVLDVGLEALWPYNLEVSSPGAHRPLGKCQDFERFKGSLAAVRLKTAMDGQKNFKGILKGVSGETVHLQVGDHDIAIAYQEIARARLA